MTRTPCNSLLALVVTVLFTHPLLGIQSRLIPSHIVGTLNLYDSNLTGLGTQQASEQERLYIKD